MIRARNRVVEVRSLQMARTHHLHPAAISIAAGAQIRRNCQHDPATGSAVNYLGQRISISSDNDGVFRCVGGDRHSQCDIGSSRPTLDNRRPDSLLQGAQPEGPPMRLAVVYLLRIRAGYVPDFSNVERTAEVILCQCPPQFAEIAPAAFEGGPSRSAIEVGAVDIQIRYVRHDDRPLLGWPPPGTAGACQRPTTSLETDAYVPDSRSEERRVGKE